MALADIIVEQTVIDSFNFTAKLTYPLPPASIYLNYIDLYQSIDAYAAPCASFQLVDIFGLYTNVFYLSKDYFDLFGISNTCNWTADNTFNWFDQSYDDIVLVVHTVPNNTQHIGSLNFGLAIVIVLLFMWSITLVYSRMTSKKPWLK